MDLKLFCGTDLFRPYLHQPFSVGEFSYATDGRIMVRIPRNPDYPEQEETAKWDAPLDGIEKAEFAPFYHRPLPSFPEPKEEDCDECDGRGHEHDCPDCSCTCEECNGSGKVMVGKEVSTMVRGSIFNLRFVSLMLTLPDIEIAISKRKGDAPLWFRFNGGVGAIMPCRNKCDEHVEIEDTQQS